MTSSTAAGAVTLLTLLPLARGAGLLLPQESESREVKSLDGLWSFKPDPGDGAARGWAKAGLPSDHTMMPVPASYNDLTQDQSLRDLVGVVWYERTVFVPLHWATQRVVLYVGSANHHARVWLNGVLVGEHEGGHLPFHLPLDPTLVAFGRASRLTIAVNNTLHATTIPPGWVQTNVAGRRVQRLQMDFFNYAGIQRQVLLYTTPLTYLDDITVSSRIDQHDAHLNVFVSAVGASSVLITLRDAEGALVTRGRMPADMRRGGRLTVSDPALWWPRYMAERPGYLYTIEVEVLGADGNVSDVYRLPHGIRTVGTRADGSFLVNGQPFYFHGFGKQEASDGRGRGLDLPMLVKDMALYEWIGGNSMRTTHYPYSPETLQLCDQLGIVVIGEAPAVGLQNQNMVRETLLKHLDVMGELVTRDKNHPSVVMWSVANEPDSEAPSAAAYFKHLVAQTKALDPSRPVSFATFKDPAKDVATPFVDVVMVNRYYGWYTNTGQTDIIPFNLEKDMLTWRRTFNKPVMMTEYGCDAVAGLHSDPPFAFTEEFQVEYISQYFATFDKLRAARFFVGEMVWNFADFLTAQGITRVHGNKKGMFTRQRQPKMAAHALRSRYNALANATRLYPLRLAALAEVAVVPVEARARPPPHLPAAPSPPSLRAAATGRSVRPGQRRHPSALRGLPRNPRAGVLRPAPRRCRPTRYRCVRSAAPAETKGRCSNRSEHTRRPPTLRPPSPSQGQPAQPTAAKAEGTRATPQWTPPQQRRESPPPAAADSVWGAHPDDSAANQLTEDALRFSGVIDPWADALVTDEQVRGGGAAALQPTEGNAAGDDQGLQVPAMGATHVWQN